MIYGLIMAILKHNQAFIQVNSSLLLEFYAQQREKTR
jgi:hypothetical protein